jgi:polar amino acid transport system substrate-binding protein
MSKIGRRTFLIGGATATVVTAVSEWARADAGAGLLQRLQAAKKVRVGIANQVPFSSLNPDGTLDGAAPSISKAILERLGITEIEGVVATYGELIPGMMAGRWDFVSASLTITKPRCTQVLFADPMILDGSALFYKKDAPAAPKSVADIVKLNAMVGSQAGGADYRQILADGVPPGNIVQFPTDLAIVDGLLANRMPYALTANSALKAVIQQRKLTDLTIVYPVVDDPPKGSACAFRRTDTDLYDAYQTELRAMKASGQFADILKRYGFETSPDLLALTADKACAAAHD